MSPPCLTPFNQFHITYTIIKSKFFSRIKKTLNLACLFFQSHLPISLLPALPPTNIFYSSINKELVIAETQPSEPSHTLFFLLECPSSSPSNSWANIWSSFPPYLGTTSCKSFPRLDFYFPSKTNIMTCLLYAVSEFYHTFNIIILLYF